MDENNTMNFSCEPEDEAAAALHNTAGQPQPTGADQGGFSAQPSYTQTHYSQPNYNNQSNNYYYDPNFRPRQSYEPQYEPPKKENKKKGTWKLVLLLVAVAVVGSVGGSLLTNAISNLRGDEKQVEKSTQQTQETEQKDQYELVTHELPDTLNSNETGKSLTPAQVYEMTVNSVVGIATESTTNVFGQEAVSASSGSGFILTEDGYVITNAHVVSGADKIQVDTFDGTTYDAQLVAADTNFDIALLKVEATGLPAVTVGDSDDLKVGEEVVAIGNPLGELTFTMTNGILSALDREINTDGNPQNMLQTNAAINSGNSGGPLFDMNGNVIGVTTAKYSGSTSSGTTIEGLGFAIPINDALKVAYDLAEYGYVKGLAYLGVSVKTLDSETASYYSLPVGPRVESVNAGSCAEKAGIQVGDIILKFNDTEVANNTELLSALRKVRAGDTAEMTLYRAGAQVTVSIVLDERPREEDIPDPNATQESSQQQTPSQQMPAQDPSYSYTFPFDPFGFGG